MENFSHDIGMAELLGTIGGLLGTKPGFDVHPVVSPGSHEIVAMRVSTERGVFEVKVEPVE
jgi:hypothetical protein